MKTFQDSLKWLGQLSQTRWFRKFYIGVVGAAFVLLGWVTVHNWQELSRYGWRWNWLALGYSCIGYVFGLFAAVFGWHSIMQHLGCSLPLRKHWKIYTFTNITKRLPGMIWYASGRLLMYQQLGVAKRITALSLVLEMFLLVYTGAMVAAFLSLLIGQAGDWSNSVWLYVALLIGLAFMAYPQVLLQSFNRLQRGYRGNPVLVEVQLTWRDMVRLMPAYMLIWLSGGAMLFWMIRAVYPLSYDLWLEILNVWTLSGLVGTLAAAFLPFGMGLREFTLLALLNRMVPFPVALAVALLSRVWLAINQLIWFGISWAL